jgi:crossover junction endodeoxyribonuclease RuvC
MICGVDPGVNGAVAMLTDTGALVCVIDTPNLQVRVGKSNKTRIATQALALFIASHQLSHAYVEDVASSPQMGVSSSFAFGQAYGIVDGILAALGVPVTYAKPAVWKRAMQVTADKGSSRRRAMQLWPTHAGEFARVKDDGRAEACLLALHGLRTQQRAAA